MNPVEDVLAVLGARAPTLAAGRLLCIDGPAGSGKTTLAAAIAERTGAPVVRMDDLYEGWSGLPEVDRHVLGILAPLAAGTPGRYRRFDWIANARAEEHLVAPAPLVILEGVGSGNAAWAPWITVLAWVETDDGTRLTRGLARDGDQFRTHWLAWMAAETDLFAGQRTRDRADLILRT